MGITQEAIMMSARLFVLAMLFNRASSVPGASGHLSALVNSMSCHSDGNDHNASGACHTGAALLSGGVHTVDPTSFASFFPDAAADVHAHDQFLPDVGHANLATDPREYLSVRKPRANPVAFDGK